MREKYIIIVAGGKGLRMGGDIPKQFMLLAGKPVLMHTVDAFYSYDINIHIILVLPDEQQSFWEELCTKYQFKTPHSIVSGGETRFHSVKNGLQQVLPNSLVGIHDGVRPLIDKELIKRCFSTAEYKEAAYPVVPVVDTLRKKNDSGSEIVDRSCYRLVQTPQVFRWDILLEAFQQDYSEAFTDDVSVVESDGKCIPVMVDGSRENIKITTPIDLVFAEALIKCRI